MEEKTSVQFTVAFDISQLEEWGQVLPDAIFKTLSNICN